MTRNASLFTTWGVGYGRNRRSANPAVAALLVGVALAMPLWMGAASAADAKVHDRGVGPIKELKLGPIDPVLAKKGGEIFKLRCSACHNLDQRRVGPPLRAVTERMAPEWIMNMLLNTRGMLKNDPTAKALLGQYLTPMPMTGVSEAEARALLEYLREASADKGGGE